MLFSAVRQTVARSFLRSSSTDLKLPDEHLLRVCTEAAEQNLQLLYRLLEVIAGRNSAFGMIDYHHAFNAAIIRELSRLTDQRDLLSKDTTHIEFVRCTLQNAGQQGNEFARDCSTVLADFCQLVDRLKLEISDRNSGTQTLGNYQALGQSTAHADALGDGGDPGMAAALTHSDLPTGYEGMFDEFMTWLDGEASINLL